MPEQLPVIPQRFRAFESVGPPVVGCEVGFDVFAFLSVNVVFLKFHYDLSIAFEGLSVDSFEIADDEIGAGSMLDMLLIVGYDLRIGRLADGCCACLVGIFGVAFEHGFCHIARLVAESGP